jgi:tetratricopeptide (TPR) repeat protein
MATFEIVQADGSRVTATYIANYDGKDYPFHSNAKNPFDSVALAKSPDASVIDVAFASVDRAGVLVESGRYRNAIAEAAKAVQAADGGQLPQGAALNVRNVALAVTAAAQGRMGDAAGAERTVALLQKEVDARPDDPFARTTLHSAQGMLAAAQKDMTAARMHFEMCLEQDFACHWQALEVSRKAGDKAGADASLARLTKLYVRVPLYVYARAMATHGASPKQTN